MKEFHNGSMYFGDCLEVMKEIPDNHVDMILCDLPYGTTACAWDKIIPFEPLWKQYWRVLKPNAAIVLTASQPFTSVLIMSNIQNFKYEWIWQKNAGSNFAQVKYQPMKEHESVLIFAQSKSPYNPQMQERNGAGLDRIKAGAVKSNTKKSLVYSNFHIHGKSKYREELRYPSSIQKFNRERGLHPTQKPVALFEYLIKTYTNEGQIVLDNCIGSGTTAIAAINTKRCFIGIEQDDKYFDIACERISNHENKTRLPF